MKTIACISLLLAVGCDSSSEPRFDQTPEATRISIAGLKTLCDGAASALIARDATICGEVVANDLYGEFLREIIIQDDTGGITVAIESQQLADRFPFGAIVEIRCNGLSLCDYGGKIEIGTEPGDDGKPGEIPEEEIGRYLRTVGTAETEPRIRILRFGEVTERHVDTRVRFEGVRFVETGAAWCDTDPETGRLVSTEREIVDSDGNRFFVRTLWSCYYGTEPLPEGDGALTGVIDYFGGKYTLRVTFREKEFPVTEGERFLYEGGGSATPSPKRPRSEQTQTRNREAMPTAYRCSASQSMSFNAWIFNPETEEMKTDGTPSGRWLRISAISSSSSMSHFVTASSRSLSSSSGLYWVSSPSRMS